MSDATVCTVCRASVWKHVKSLSQVIFNQGAEKYGNYDSSITFRLSFLFKKMQTHRSFVTIVC